MTTLFGILGVGANGLASSSFALNVTSQNASNIATEGYSRRSAVIEPIGPPPAGGGGSRANGALRVIDPFLERRLLGARSAMSEAAARTRTLGVLDSVFAEGPGGLGQALDAFESAIDELAARPNEPGARAVVLARAEGLAQSFQDAAASLAEARTDANDRIEAEVGEVNERLHRIADLGVQISQAEISGHEASDLRDRRDQLVREVADRVPVTVVEEPSGQISLLLAGSQALVSPDGRVSELSAVPDAATGDVRIAKMAAGASVDVTSLLTSGSISGTIGARDGALATATASLDQLAFDIATAYNAVHSAGVGLDGASGRNLFEPIASVTGAASRLAVSTDVAGRPDLLAAATSAASLPGDNRGALALKALADSATVAGGGTMSAGAALSALIGQVGGALGSARAMEDAASARADQVAQLRESVSGVSADEEMVAMMRLQRAYQASLKVVEVADEMLGELLQLKR